MSAVTMPLDPYRIHEVPTDLLAALDYCYEQGWTDGLPVVPPTESAVRAMLAAAGLEPGTQIAFITNRQVEVTAEKVAVNAVMAGCLPEYMPIVVAAVVYWTVRTAASFVAAGRLLPEHRRFLTLMMGFVLAAGALVVWGRPYFRQLEFRTALLVLAPDEFATDRIEFAPAAARVIRRRPLGLGIGGFSMYYFGYDAKRGGRNIVFLSNGRAAGDEARHAQPVVVQPAQKIHIR